MGMRKLLLFLFSTLMFGGGIYWTVAEAVYEDRVSSKLNYMITAGGVMLTMLGAYLLWIDFVAPALNIKTWEDK